MTKKRRNQLLKTSLNNFDEYKQPYSKQYAYETLFMIDTLMGNYKRALYNLSMVRKIEHLNLTRSKQYVSRMMEVSSKLSLLEEEATHLKTQKKNTLFFAIFAIIALSFLFIILWISNNNKNKQRILQEKAEKFELQNLLSNIGEIQFLKKNYSVSSEEKNKFQTLDQQFELAYAKSISQFKKAFKQLTDNDIRYAVLFALNVSDSVIAKIRNISPDSVQKTKRRIRVKLELEKGTNLHYFFSPYMPEKSTLS